MSVSKSDKISILSLFLYKVRDYGVLMKFKLSLTVVFSAVMSFLIVLDTPLNWFDLAILTLGGLFTSGAAGALNQVLEQDFDKMMRRTENRPVAAGRMSVTEALLASGVMSLLGVSLLALFNPLTAFLGMVSLISYAFVYTPLKRVSNIAVPVGAIPGALPIVIGCTAAQGGVLTSVAITLFLLQFIWQFPHFWAIAWLGDDDYKKAGFKLLPTKDGTKDSETGRQSMIYAGALLPVSWMPFYLGTTGLLSAVILSILAIIMVFFGWKLYKDCSRKAALSQMFYSLAYLPIALCVLYFDKL